VARRAEARDRQHLGTDHERPLGPNAGDGFQELGLRDGRGDLRDVTINARTRGAAPR
jgi:hypothetical protein